MDYFFRFLSKLSIIATDTAAIWINSSITSSYWSSRAALFTSPISSPSIANHLYISWFCSPHLTSCLFLSDNINFTIVNSLIYIKNGELILDGILNLDELETELEKQPAIVSIMAVNNETGIIQNIASIGELCDQYHSYLHTDAAQAVGRINLDVKEMNIMAMSISGHKFYGPKGIGVFFIDRKIKNNIGPKRVISE